MFTVCLQTLRPSDDVLRQQIRDLTIPGLLSFDQWRQQQTTPTLVGEVGAVVVPSSRAETVAIANGKAAKTTRRSSTAGRASSPRGKATDAVQEAAGATMVAVETPEAVAAIADLSPDSGNGSNGSGAIAPPESPPTEPVAVTGVEAEVQPKRTSRPASQRGSTAKSHQKAPQADVTGGCGSARHSQTQTQNILPGKG